VREVALDKETPAGPVEEKFVYGTFPINCISSLTVK
jgi:hypothetical protein